MNINVVQCRGLPARDSNVGSSDPYVKLQILPDKHHKVKTRVLRRTQHPVYDEDFTFYGIGENQLQVCLQVSLAVPLPWQLTLCSSFCLFKQSLTLHFVVLSFDRYSRDDVIGEVLLPVCEALESATATDATLDPETNIGNQSDAVLVRDIAPRSLKVSVSLLMCGL